MEISVKKQIIFFLEANFKLNKMEKEVENLIVTSSI